MVPSLTQIAVVWLSCLFLAIAWTLLVRRGLRDTVPRSWLPQAFCALAGIASLTALLWHMVQRQAWVPAEDNFDALLTLSLVVGALTAYLQATRPVFGLPWIMLPVIIGLQVSAMFFGRIHFHDYHVTTAWNWTHRLSNYLGAAAFAVAFAGGCLYLLARRRLRRKEAHRHQAMSSLERLENLTRSGVIIGFALLTVGLITGVVEAIRYGSFDNHAWLKDPKIILAMVVWVIYALVLHAPINPSFRGRRSAWLSIIGFAVMILAIVAAQVRFDGGVP